MRSIQRLAKRPGVAWVLLIGLFATIGCGQQLPVSRGDDPVCAVRVPFPSLAHSPPDDAAPPAPAEENGQVSSEGEVRVEAGIRLRWPLLTRDVSRRELPLPSDHPLLTGELGACHQDLRRLERHGYDWRHEGAVHDFVHAQLLLHLHLRHLLRKERQLPPIGWLWLARVEQHVAEAYRLDALDGRWWHDGVPGDGGTTGEAGCQQVGYAASRVRERGTGGLRQWADYEEALCWSGGGRWTEAKRLLERVVRSTRGDEALRVDAMFRLASGVEDHTEAIRWYLEVPDTSPDKPHAWLRAAFRACDDGNPEQALSLLARVVTDVPELQAAAESLRQRIETDEAQAPEC